MQDIMNMKKNIAWNTIGSIYYSFCQWLMTVIIVYLTADYGIIGNLGLAMTITNSFTTISSFGMRSFQISDTNHQFSDSEYIASRRITALAAFVLCGVYVAAIGSNIQEATCIMSYMILRLIESTEDVYQGVLQINWRYDIIGKSYIIRGTLQILFFTLGFYFSKDLVITFILMILSNIPVLLLYDERNVKRIAKTITIIWSKNIIKLFQVCSVLVLYNFMSNSLATVVRVSIKKYMGREALGIYSTVASPTVIVQLLASVVFSPFLPLSAKAYNSGNKKLFSQYIKKITLCIFVGFFAVNIATILFGEWGLQLLYNSDIASHDELLLPLVWCTFFAAAVWLYAGTLISIRAIKPLICGMTVAFTTNYILGEILVKNLGMNGASYAQVISEVLLMIYLFIVVWIKKNRMKNGNDEEMKYERV